MGNEDASKDARSLAPPSLRLGRKRRQPPEPPVPETSPHTGPAGAEDEAEAGASADTVVERVDQPAAEAAPPARPTAAPREPTARATEEGAQRPTPPRTRPGLPPIGDRPAAAVTGVLVGLVLVGATFGSQALCEGVRGTPSCGAAGLPLIVGVLAVAVLLGAAMLRAFGVPSAGSISFLSVALVAVLSVLFLTDDGVLGWWSVVVVPLLCAAAYPLFHWVAVSYIDPTERDPDLRQ